MQMTVLLFLVCFVSKWTIISIKKNKKILYWLLMGHSTKILDFNCVLKTLKQVAMPPTGYWRECKVQIVVLDSQPPSIMDRLKFQTSSTVMRCRFCMKAFTFIGTDLLGLHCACVTEFTVFCNLKIEAVSIQQTIMVIIAVFRAQAWWISLLLQIGNCLHPSQMRLISS